MLAGRTWGQRAADPLSFAAGGEVPIDQRGQQGVQDEGGQLHRRRGAAEVRRFRQGGGQTLHELGGTFSATQPALVVPCGTSSRAAAYNTHTPPTTPPPPLPVSREPPSTWSVTPLCQSVFTCEADVTWQEGKLSLALVLQQTTSCCHIP